MPMMMWFDEHQAPLDGMKAIMSFKSVYAAKYLGRMLHKDQGYKVGKYREHLDPNWVLFIYPTVCTIGKERAMNENLRGESKGAAYKLLNGLLRWDRQLMEYFLSH